MNLEKEIMFYRRGWKMAVETLDSKVIGPVKTIDTDDILSDQGFVYLDVVKSIVKGIKLGDEIPLITVARFDDVLDVISLEERSNSEFFGKYVVHNGNHRAKAWLEAGKKARARVIQSERYLKIFKIDYCNMALRTIAEVPRCAFIRDLPNRMKHDFYREIE